MKTNKTTLAGLGLMVALQAGVAQATVTRRYVEDFATTQYKDVANTTASWDTIAGHIGLPRASMSYVATYNTPGRAYKVVVAGDHAYVADGSLGLRVVSIADPANPVSAGTYDTPGNAWDLAVDGNYAYVADGTGDLQVINVSDPTNPTLAGSYGFTGEAWGIAVDGDRAYVAGFTGGMVVVDISTPATPALVGTFASAGSAQGIDIDGDYAFLAEGSAGFEVVSIVNPASPSLVGSYNTPGLTYEVSIDGDYLYVSDYSNGVIVMDVSNPASPALLGSYNTPGSAWDVAVAGDYLYVADAAPGIQVLDISDPTTPVLVESYDTGYALGVAVDGGNAFVAADTYGLVVMRVARSVDPVLVGSQVEAGDHNDVAFVGNYAFVAAHEGGAYGLRVLDVTDPTAPAPLAWAATTGTAEAIAVAGDYAYVADGAAGLRAVDISDPASPTLAGVYDTPGSAEDVAVAGNYAYVADGTDGGLQVINITSPSSPTFAGSYDTSGEGLRVVLSGNHAYIADGASGLKVIDISSPVAPAQVGSLPLWAGAVDVAGDYAYTVYESTPGYAGLRVIDISDPTAPVALGFLGLPQPRDMQVAGDYVYVVTHYGGFYKIDVSNPASPAVGFSHVFLPYAFERVTLSGDHAHLYGRLGHRQVFKIFERWFDPAANTGQSLPISPPGKEVRRVRMTTTQADSVAWQLSANAGANWTSVARDGSWQTIATPGSDLRWKSTHLALRGGNNPACASLEVDWLFADAVIDSIRDLPNDEGHQARIWWTRSGEDFVGSATQVTEYAIYRRIDAGAALEIEGGGRSPTGQVKSDPAPGIRRTYPPGDWDFVTTVPADAQDGYIVTVPTLADSSIAHGMHYTTFFVSAFTATPGVYFDSAPDSGYSVDNLAPAAPQGFGVAYNTGSGNQLSWAAPEEPDFVYCNVYRSTDPNFTPGPGNLVHATAASAWNDPAFDGWDVYYKVTAVDYAGNESDPSSTGTATGVTDRALPASFALHRNVPNPFNPTTVIPYDVPAGGAHVTLTVYDVTGRVVRTLLDTHVSQGRRSVTWDGCDHRGRAVASGVYFYRLEASGYAKTHKMVLVE